ncbi:CoA transferase [Bradyrhizobium sp. 192]|uniref:CoA transferase n=1 Tax=Bradyrhizobium sp. 192 TaxID=2782660 RepID=UPI001FFF4B06|nr:CoA transferase [Bradyrhizobium sp. 192]
MLGDLGADVIKIERSVTSDETRSYGPPSLEDTEGKPTDNTSFFLCANRNKRVSHRQPCRSRRAGDRSCSRKERCADRNYKVGDLRRYGLDYDSIRKVSPDIIYCSITGYGQSGPYAARASYDAVVQAGTGIMSLSGHAGDPSHMLPGVGFHTGLSLRFWQVSTPASMRRLSQAVITQLPALPCEETCRRTVEARNGCAAVLLISEDLDEQLGLADRGALSTSFRPRTQTSA